LQSYSSLVFFCDIIIDTVEVKHGVNSGGFMAWTGGQHECMKFRKRPKLETNFLTVR